MGVKKSLINLSGILAPNWVTQLGSTSLVLVGTGTHIMVPGPPAGKLRAINKFGNLSPVATQVSLATSDGAILTGDFDYTPQINSTQIDQTQTGVSGFLLPAALVSVILQSGEAYTVNIGAFNGGADRAIGYATWADFDLLPNISVVRLTIPSTTPVTLIPTVPAAKTANGYAPPSLIASNTPAFGVFNADTVPHNFIVEVVVAGVPVQVGSGSASDGQANSFLIPAIPAGTSLQITMAEPVTTTAPRIYGAYQLLDV
jgi:hypothetical protein